MTRYIRLLIMFEVMPAPNINAAVFASVFSLVHFPKPLLTYGKELERHPALITHSLTSRVIRGAEATTTGFAPWR